uniref:Uncharacterized protein n=1 Tax=Bosea sp. NBC_00436 TaxID=2969620 RepID=A0A9E7ZYQ1_9HYPH
MEDADDVALHGAEFGKGGFRIVMKRVAGLAESLAELDHSATGAGQRCRKAADLGDVLGRDRSWASRRRWREHDPAMARECAGYLLANPPGSGKPGV